MKNFFIISIIAISVVATTNAFSLNLNSTYYRAWEPVGILQNHKDQSIVNEDEAIKNMIKLETQYFYSGDFEKFKSCWSKSEHLEWAYSFKEGELFIEGYEELMDKVSNWISTRETKDMTEMLEFDHLNWKINSDGKMAYANVTHATTNKSTQQSSSFRKLLVLEKEAEIWKIIKQYAIYLPEDISEEDKLKEAVKKSINDETHYYYSGDFENWKNHFVEADYISWSVTPGNSPGEAMRITGYQNLTETFKKWMDGRPVKDLSGDQMHDRDHWNIQIRGDIAYVTFEDTVTKKIDNSVGRVF